MKRTGTVRMLLSMLRTLVSREKGTTVLLLGAIALSIAAALLPPLALERIVDSLTDGVMIAFTAALLYFAFTLLSAAADAALNALLAIFGQKMTRELRTQMCEKLNRLPAGTFVRQEPGQTVARLVGDVDAVEDIFADGVIGMLVDVCKVVSILAMICTRSRGLALLLLVCLPLVFLFTRWTQKHMLASQIENRAALARANGVVPETIRNIRTIHTLRRERYLEEKYDATIQASYAAMERVNLYDAIYSPVVTVMRAMIVGLMMVLCGTMKPGISALFGMSVGASVAAMTYITKVFAPIEAIGMEIQTIQSAIAGAKRVNDFLNQAERPAPDETLRADELVRSEAPVIELRDVAFAYEDGRDVLRGLSIRIERGEQVTLIGRTGAGKSTVFKLLLGLYAPREGSVRVYGADAEAIPAGEKRRLIGYVEQSFTPVPGTMLDQITLFDPHVSREAAMAAAQTVGLGEALTRLPDGIDTVCTPDVFSQGQWQLLSIARAIAADPAILLLDEITANLDSDTEQAVLRAVKNASAQRTVLSISHRLYQSLGGRTITIE